MTFTTSISGVMRAAVIHRFGGIDTLSLQTLPVPGLRQNEVLIQIKATGVGAWDRQEREGLYADFLGKPEFPYVLGWDAGGYVVAAGAAVNRFKPGDRVYTALTPKSSGGRLYAQYAAVEADDVWLAPEKLTMEQAGVMGWDALTALTGLDHVLGLARGESLMIFGASGGIGHLAVQLAKSIGARVLAVASGDDGVALALRMGADTVVNGRADDVTAAARLFAPGGLDAALLTTGGAIAQRAMEAVREGGRVAYPNGVLPVPEARPGVNLVGFDADRSPEMNAKLHRLIDSGPFNVHVSDVFSLEQVKQAHEALEKHYVGKIALKPG
jgi:NADPH:quinone reductase